VPFILTQRQQRRKGAKNKKNEEMIAIKYEMLKNQNQFLCTCIFTNLVVLCAFASLLPLR
jgi:hypothetical protein